jgi:uncharacterized membrane-anchored protein
MISSKQTLAAALIFPIAVLGTLTGYRHYVYTTGQEITLPISGCDPRDLISGHYLAYQIDYDVKDICKPIPIPSMPATICLTPKMFSYGESPPKTCTLFIRGTCESSQFSAGIERYYVPEHQGEILEKEVRSKKASILISVTKNGDALVKDLLIDGKSWKAPYNH